MTSLFGGTEECPPDARNGVAELFEYDTEGVSGLMEEAGLPLSDEMAEMRLSHEEDLFKVSSSLPSGEGVTS